MNTNEFRHPKERLQNLSSRHKVSDICYHCFILFLTTFLCYVNGNIQNMCIEKQFKDLDASMCVSDDVPAGCYPAHSEEIMSTWGMLSL